MEFSAQLQLIQERGFNVLALSTVVERIRTGQALPDKTLVITFDDAYVSIHREAYPRLAALGWPFTIFVGTAAVGSRGYLTWDELREMHDHGASIANHSRTHPHLTRRLPGEDEEQWLQRLADEIDGAEAVIAREIGESLRYHAYPYGEYDNRVKRWLREHGYTGFGQQSGAVGRHADFMVLPRYPIAGDYTDLDEFLLKAKSLPLPVLNQDALPDPSLPEEITRPALELTLAPGDYVMARLACYSSGQGAIEVERLDGPQFRVRAKRALPPGRSRYNCTAPRRDGDRYYWFSYQWLRPGGRD